MQPDSGSEAHCDHLWQDIFYNLVQGLRAPTQFLDVASADEGFTHYSKTLFLCMLPDVAVFPEQQQAACIDSKVLGSRLPTAIFIYVAYFIA